MATLSFSPHVRSTITFVSKAKQSYQINKMSSFIRKAFLDTSSPLIQFQRYRGKINIQRPRTPHYDRALFNAVTKPVYREPTVTERCAQRQAEAAAAPIAVHKRVENPYEKIIAKEVRNWFTQSKMVAIFHINSISSEDMFNARVQLHKQNMHLKAYSKSVMREALVGTQFESTLPLFYSKNCVVFSPEQNLNKLQKIIRKIPQIVLLAGIVEGRLMSKTELVAYAALPSLDIARAQFASVLQNAGGNSLVTLLQANQTQLAAALDTLASQTQGEPEVNSTPTDDSSPTESQ